MLKLIKLIRYLRYLYTPFICSLLVLTSELCATKLYKKRKLIFIPIFSLSIAIVSSIIQLINPIFIRDLMLRNEYYYEMSRSTNFLRGSIHNRLIGVFNDPNLFGAFLTLNIIFIILYSDSKNELKKSVKYIIPLMVILFLTTSRSSIITLLFCCSVYFISKVNANKINIRNFGKNTFGFLVVIVLFVIGLTWIFRSLNLSMEILLTTRFNWQGINELRTFNNRSLEWPYIINVFSENLLTIFFGVSHQNFQLSFSAIENTFIGLNFKYGIFVFILTISYVVRLLKRSNLNKSEKRMLIGLLLLLGLISDIDTLLFITAPIFILLSVGKNGLE